MAVAKDCQRGHDGRRERIVRVRYRFVGKGKPLPYKIWYEDNKSHHPTSITGAM